jgi:hypothetical protein
MPRNVGDNKANAMGNDQPIQGASCLFAARSTVVCGVTRRRPSGAAAVKHLNSKRRRPRDCVAASTPRNQFGCLSRWHGHGPFAGITGAFLSRTSLTPESVDGAVPECVTLAINESPVQTQVTVSYGFFFELRAGRLSVPACVPFLA